MENGVHRQLASHGSDALREDGFHSAHYAFRVCSTFLLLPRRTRFRSVMLQICSETGSDLECFKLVSFKQVETGMLQTGSDLVRNRLLNRFNWFSMLTMMFKVVWEVPVGAEVIAFSDKTRVEIIGIQGHPEYTKDILNNLIDRLFIFYFEILCMHTEF
ncbi:Gamma-glutamyl peptidase 5 [Camellia lanceoleosa]|uniref:Gamma-glutamyl peptidase 5 n=1 Tax=Camellia lanceoleosa TaxID=1840588 RepID=A0ACC0FZ94_9ERIC|nr:Gamma-glutamyl peptidase 5 [Camellia lanceoleosa]